MKAQIIKKKLPVRKIKCNFDSLEYIKKKNRISSSIKYRQKLSSIHKYLPFIIELYGKFIHFDYANFYSNNFILSC